MITDTYSAKTHLSRLLDQVERGEEVIITRRGKPVAKLVRFEAAPPTLRPVVFGLLRTADVASNVPALSSSAIAALWAT